MKILLLTFILLIFIWMAFSVIYQFILAFTFLFKKEKKSVGKTPAKKNFLVVVPAYKEDKVIIDSTRKNLMVRYPQVAFDILVIAQKMKMNTIQELRAMGVKVLEYNADQSTKVKALKKLIENGIPNAYDAIVLLDADNIMKSNFLIEASRDLRVGKRVIQGLRTASTMQTDFEVLDGFSERANHNLLCEAANSLGFSARLSGSGMVIVKKLFEDVIMDQNAIGGFDKEMEMEMAIHGEHIYYNEEMIVVDQKISSSEAFSQQRARWIQAQFKYLGIYGLKAIMNPRIISFDFLFKLAQLALAPRAVIAPMLFLLANLSMILSYHFLAGIMLFLVFINLATYWIVIPKTWIKENYLMIIQAIPRLMKSVLASFKFMKKASKVYLHTAHSKS